MTVNIIFSRGKFGCFVRFGFFFLCGKGGNSFVLMNTKKAGKFMMKLILMPRK